MIELRPYQERGVSSLVKHNRAVIKSIAGSGKTLMGAEALRRIIPNSPKGAEVWWLGYTVEQISQAKDAVALFPEISEHFDLNFCCYATLPDLSKAFAVVCDECHRVGATENEQMLLNCNPDAIRWGLSATPKRADDRAHLVFELLGPIVETIGRDELLASGHIAHAKVQFHTTNCTDELEAAVETAAWPEFAERFRKWPYLAVTRRTVLHRALQAYDAAPSPELWGAVMVHLRYLADNDANEQWRRVIWQMCQKIALFENSARNEYVAALILNELEDNHAILVTVGSIEHGKHLLSLVEAGGGRGVACYSKMGKKARAKALQDFAEGGNNLLLVTTLGDEGLDLPRTDTMILTGGGRSDRASEQRTGRALRPFKDKAFGMIHDFTDEAHYMTSRQSWARRHLYEKLGYEIISENKLNELDIS